MEEIPVLKLGPLLMVSLQTELNDRTAQDLQSSILDKIERYKVYGLLIDISALEMLDSYIGRVLSETAAMANLMDTRVVLVGMRPEVTLTLLEMGLTIPNIRTAMDVEAGLWQLGYRLVKTDVDDD